MGRTNRAIDNAHTKLTDWGEWCFAHLDNSNIGHPPCTAEGRAMKEGAGISSGWMGSKCPEVMAPPRIRRVDEVVRRMPGYVRTAIYCKYYPEGAEALANIQVKHSGKWSKGDQMRLFKAITGLQVNDYYACWREGQSWIAGSVA